MRYALNYSVQDFCPLKIKITQFPKGFRLNFFYVQAKETKLGTFF